MTSQYTKGSRGRSSLSIIRRRQAWYATSNEGVGSQTWMLTQNQTMRTNALGSFERLLLALTHDRATLRVVPRR